MEGIRKKLTALRSDVEAANERESQAKEEASKAREDVERVRSPMWLYIYAEECCVWDVNMFS